MQSDDRAVYRNTYDNANITGGAVHLGDQYVHVHNHGLTQSEAIRSQLLNSIRLPEMNARLIEISTTKHDTFEWFLDVGTPTEPLNSDSTRDRKKRQHNQAFRNWLKTGRGFFQIKGKPGSEKSTFMKFPSQHRITSNLLRERSALHPPLMLLTASGWLVPFCKTV